VKKAFTTIIAIAGLGLGLFYVMPLLKTNTKPNNWAEGQKSYVPKWMKYKMKGMSTGF
jgi:hypothetical protein